MNNTQSWLRSIVCCLYVVYSQLMMIFSIVSYKGYLENTIIAILCLLISITILRTSRIGIYFAIIFPLIVIFSLIFPDILPPIYFYEDRRIIFIATLILTFLPSIICAFLMLINKDVNNKDEDINLKITDTNYLIKSILYLFAFAFNSIYFLLPYWIVHARSPVDIVLEGYYNIIIYYLIVIPLFVFYTVKLLNKNNFALKISILFPFVILYVVTLFVLSEIFCNYINNLIVGYIPNFIYFIMGIIGFVVLWSFSLYFYNKKSNDI
jgi:hypothetical protein